MDIAKKNKELLDEIQEAKDEWKRALMQFEYAEHPDAIDFSAFYIQAAERRYMYLLNKYKQWMSENGL
ncbi:DUF2508 family protein [Tepidibacillus infernus]|uniref:DUF2508 family protein n=1 Tax=Tepidibacillus TaxID=1494427 RepID=UPI0008538643|nr:DUF2508 family protein [Tepidibacillus sp. HK-1]GBF11431.1 hypothetical protein HK1_01459 [Tepidibacillus sp. HK-1]